MRLGETWSTRMPQVACVRNYRFGKLRQLSAQLRSSLSALAFDDKGQAKPVNRVTSDSRSDPLVERRLYRRRRAGVFPTVVCNMQ